MSLSKVGGDTSMGKAVIAAAGTAAAGGALATAAVVGDHYLLTATMHRFPNAFAAIAQRDLGVQVGSLLAGAAGAAVGTVTTAGVAGRAAYGPVADAHPAINPSMWRQIRNKAGHFFTSRAADIQGYQAQASQGIAEASTRGQAIVAGAQNWYKIGQILGRTLITPVGALGMAVYGVFLGPYTMMGPQVVLGGGALVVGGGIAWAVGGTAVGAVLGAYGAIRGALSFHNKGEK